MKIFVTNIFSILLFFSGGFCGYNLAPPAISEIQSMQRPVNPLGYRVVEMVNFVERVNSITHRIINNEAGVVRIGEMVFEVNGGIRKVVVRFEAGDIILEYSVGSLSMDLSQEPYILGNFQKLLRSRAMSPEYVASMSATEEKGFFRSAAAFLRSL